MSICFQPYIHDPAHGLWTVPPTTRDDPESFELSLSNANGIDLLCALRLAPARAPWWVIDPVISDAAHRNW